MTQTVTLNDYVMQSTIMLNSFIYEQNPQNPKKPKSHSTGRTSCPADGSTFRFSTASAANHHRAKPGHRPVAEAFFGEKKRHRCQYRIFAAV